MTVKIVRAAGRTIELHRECLRENRAAIEQALNEMAPTRKDTPLSVVAALSPSRRFAYRATEDEAKKLRTSQAIVAHAAFDRGGANGPLAAAFCGSDDGKAVAATGSSRWLMVGAAQDSLAESQAWLADFNLKEAVTSPAITGHLGALTMASQLSGAPSSVLLWDLGDTRSHLYIVNRKGVLATQPCSVGYNQIVDAIQTELALASASAASKLFLNTFFDFTETGPKIARRIAPTLRSALASLGGAPSALFCVGLPSDNAWFAKDISTALNIDAWKPGMSTLSRELGVDFLGNTLAGKIGTGGIGLIQLIGAHAAKSDTWRPHWQMLATQEQPAPGKSAVAASHSVPPPAKKVSNPPSAKSESARITAIAEPAQKVVRPSTPSIVTQASVHATAVSKQPSAAVSTHDSDDSETDAATPTAIAPGPGGRTETKALLTPTVVKKPATDKAAAPTSGGSVSMAIRRSAAFTAPPGPSPAQALSPSPPSKSPKDVSPSVTRGNDLPIKRSNRTPILVVAFAIIAVALGFGWVTYTAREAQALAVSKQKEVERIAADTIARATASQEAAQQETERVRREAAAERESAIADVKLKTEEEVMLRVEAERLAHAPGVLIVTTEPTGAHVSIDGALPQAAPLTTNDLSIGTHRIAISFPGFDTATRTVEIKRGQTTDLGLVELTRQYGVIEIISEPAGLAFELRSADTKPEAEPILTGTTPATVGELTVGDYTVTLLRDGWKPLLSKATVTSLATTQVVPLYATARLLISSTPSGATVLSDGEAIGVTPLQLSDLTPGELTFDLTLADHETGKVKIRLIAGAETEVTAPLDRFDRILKNSEVAQAPVAIKTVKPEFSLRDPNESGKVVVSCVIDRLGVPQSLQIESSTNADFAKACVAALQQWRFSPAKTKAGKVANVRVTIPFNLAPR